ncbi:DNA topoisomerase 1 [Chlamydiales bacterium SCGC AB-751-O23]|jgi:DNA topoisomerase I|nr:DNA topoisomerase 1 [Chlamydiales bacterium SCGC AB-751-O23]
MTKGLAKKTLIIVESPAKIKTLKKFLGDEYLVESSVGHVRDLPQKDFGIDVENDFDPQYTTMPDKKKVIANIKKAAKACDMVFLSPDPDREGEAIAWHIMHLLPPKIPFKRVTFNSLTKDAVLKAIKEPRDIDQDLVDAQQARRLLDRMVGYKISPILSRRIQKKVAGSLSAGRVQSVALKLVVDREGEILAFIPVEHWNLKARFEDQEEEAFNCYLHSIDGIKIDKEDNPQKKTRRIADEATASSIEAKIREDKFTVTKVSEREKKRNAVPPFITSTLQQEASRHYGFSATRTMRAAQDLYEGIDMGKEGQEGLITYMRTDSVRISDEASDSLRFYIKDTFGPEYLPEKLINYSSKKNAQDAHEAIRPTNLEHPPELVQPFLDTEQFKLYSLIWKRFIASQMSPAIYDTISCDIEGGEGFLFRATGSRLKFKGFLAVYEEKTDEDPQEGSSINLPKMHQGQSLDLNKLLKEQSFTKPPARFTEASLVKELEKSGIGRPSTYASIMTKIQSREYTIKESKRLKPTELGKVIAAMLEDHFPLIMNISFTAEMEDKLEKIAQEGHPWKTLIKDFWSDFVPVLEVAEKEAKVPTIPTELDCPQCKKGKLHKVWSRTKYFYGCEHYPDCSFTAPMEEIHFDKSEYDPSFNWEQKCPLCTKEMAVKHGRFGAFLGCSTYPDCKGIVNIPKLGEQVFAEHDLPKCPAVGCEGQILQRKSRYGKFFFSCSAFPDCNVIVNNLEDLPEKYKDHPKTAYVKSTKGKKGAKKAAKKAPAKKKAAKKAVKKVAGKKVAGKKVADKKEVKKRIPKSFLCSDLLQSIIQEKSSTRGDAIKKLWDYIRKNNLQDPKDKRVILPDSLLSQLFETKEPISMFKFSSFVSKNLLKEGS